MSGLNSAIVTAAASLTAQGDVLGAVADNIANANTPGYKRQIATLIDQGVAIPEVFLRRDFSQGPVVPTGNPNDLAVEGNGFFQVALPNGQTAYTRDGSLGLSPNAALVDVNGNPIVGPIQVNPAGGPLTVAADGTVSQTINGATQVLGRVQLATFTNPGGLAAQSGNDFSPTFASGQAIPGGDGSQVVQGAIEGSNVDLAQEFVTMITAKTVYEASARVITTASSMEAELLRIV